MFCNINICFNRMGLYFLNVQNFLLSNCDVVVKKAADWHSFSESDEGWNSWMQWADMDLDVTQLGFSLSVS